MAHSLPSAGPSCGHGAVRGLLLVFQRTAGQRFPREPECRLTCAGRTGKLLRDYSWQSGFPCRSRSPAPQNASPFPVLLYKVSLTPASPVVLARKGIETVERMCRPFLSPSKNYTCLWSVSPAREEGIGPQSRTSLLASLSRAALDSSGLLPVRN